MRLFPFVFQQFFLFNFSSARFGWGSLETFTHFPLDRDWHDTPLLDSVSMFGIQNITLMKIENENVYFQRVIIFSYLIKHKYA